MDGGSFVPLVQYEKGEIHTVFLPFSYFPSKQNLSPPPLADLIRGSLEIIIPSDEPVRLLNAVLDELDNIKLTATYSCFGRIDYSPRLLFKVVLYACCRGIYSSREIKRACHENVNFMYLLEGQEAPDHNTIAGFAVSICPRQRKVCCTKWCSI